MSRNNYAVAVGGVANTAGTEPWSISNGASAPLMRGNVYDILVSSNSTPNDNVTAFAVQRTGTAAGSGGVTPITIDSGSPNATLDAASLGSPSLTASAFLMRFSVNQRATFRWVAAPNGALTIPATANQGMALTIISTNAAHTHDHTVHWYE